MMRNVCGKEQGYLDSGTNGTSVVFDIMPPRLEIWRK